MKLDTGNHAIVCRSYGDFTAYACTVKNAQAILDEHLDNLPSEVSEVAAMLADSERSMEPVAGKLVQETLTEVLAKQPGDASAKLRRLLFGAAPRDGEDTRPEAVVTEETQQEVVLWLFKHGLSAMPLDPRLVDRLNELHPEKELALLVPFAARMGKPIHYVRYPDYFEAARALATLRANRWKDDAEEHQVVERYLDFVRKWLVDTSDVTYVVSEFNTAFA